MGLTAVLLAFAAIMGAVIGLGNPLLVAPLMAIGAVVALVVAPLRWSTWLLFVSAFLLVGPAIYFARIEVARWAAPALALALFAPYVLALLRRPPGGARAGVGVPALLGWYLVFLVVLAFSTVISAPRFGEIVLSTRIYLAYLPVTLLLLSGLIDAEDQERLWKFLMASAVIQVPVVAYQAYVVAGNRAVQTAVWDAVVGTFPGNPETGGSNAGMSLFVLIAGLTAVSLWRTGAMRGWRAAGVALSAFAVIIMGEVKAIVLMIPVSVALLYYKDLLRRPARSLGGVVVGLVLAAAIFMVYDRVYYAERQAPSARSPDSALGSIENQLNPALALRGNIASRAYTFADWGSRNLRGSKVVEALVGYGAGSTQLSRLGVGEVVERLHYKPDITATGLLLWDAGIVGHLLLLASFLAAAAAAFRLQGNAEIPLQHRAILHAVAIGMVLHLLCLPYKDFMFRAAPSQLLLFFSFGYIAYWQRFARGRR